MTQFLKRVLAEEVRAAARRGLPKETIQQAAIIVQEVQEEGEAALRRWAEKLGDLKAGESLIYRRDALQAEAEALDPLSRGVLERGAERVRTFAQAQRDSLSCMEVKIPGGSAGQQIIAVDAAGCYAPGGRFPLPSTVLMTVVTAKVAGVPEVWVASPRPTAETLAAAAIAGADGLLAVGGAQAVAAMAFGVGGLPPCGVVVGPGNRWVTAAKQLLSGQVGIDMLAGPTELLVLADQSANAQLVAADLLAQAEHDVDAMPILVSTTETLVAAVEEALAEQLAVLPTVETARAALKNGFAVVVEDAAQAIEVADQLAPEHLQISMEDADLVANRCNHAGAIFVGEGSAEVLGDYCAGPNHTLPTGQGARFRGGLAVFDYVRIRTWLRIDEHKKAVGLYEDAAKLAEMEGLAGHRRAAELRRDLKD